MRTGPLTDHVHRWHAAPPALTGTFDADATALTGHTATGEELLAHLPPRPERDAEQQQLADTVLTGCRALRHRFVHRHAEPLYDHLTHARTDRPRLPELAYDAARHVPGLTPTRDRIDEERRHLQAHKDGHEIDQGILFRGLLRSPAAGRHLMDTMRTPTPRALDLLPRLRHKGRVDLDTVLVERHDGAAHLTFHNDHCLNAEDNQLIDDMETAVDLALLDEDTRVGVLRGGVMTHPRYAGRRVFSAGINLTDLWRGRISFLDFLLRRELGYLSKLVHGLLLDPAPDAPPEHTVHKPWIAAVDSFAIGGGMQLLLAADVVIAAEDAFFSLPAAQEGIVPGAGNLRLTRHAGARLARQIILSGRRIRATDREAATLCDTVVPADAVGAAVDAAVRDLGSPAVAANRRMLNLAEEPPDLLRAYLAEFAYVQATRLHSPDVLAKVGRSWARPRTGP
uniref:DpgC n=1 Tax=Streptomyces roseoverticillatus TaxID=66429 RepID=A0A0S3TVU6_9ACTN|nr:DpgC [Streptomyces roseoverticillatus]